MNRQDNIHNRKASKLIVSFEQTNVFSLFYYLGVLHITDTQLLNDSCENE